MNPSKSITGPPLSLTRVASLMPMILLLLFSLGVVWGLAFWHLGVERADALAEATVNVKGYANTFSNRTRRLLREMDQATRFLKLQFEEREGQGLRIDLAEYTRRQGLLPTDEALRISLVNAEGVVVDSNRPFKAATSLADRDYFKAHLVDDGDTLHISQPLLGRGIQRWVIALSRRLNHADGSFAGLIVIAVEPEYFTGAYDPSILHANGFVSLLGTDGFFRAARVGDKVLPGQAQVSAVFSTWALAGTEGTAVIDSPLDGARRIFSYQRVVDFPLVAAVGISEADALAAFEKERILYLRAAAIASVLLAALWAILLIQGRRLRASRRADRQAAARLRLITDNMPSLICYLDIDQHIRFANQAYRDWLGVDPETMVGKTLLEFYGTDVYAQISQHIEAALGGTAVVYERELKTVSGMRPVHVTAVPHRDDKGRVVGLYVTTHDLTLQRTMMRSAREQGQLIEQAHRHSAEQAVALDQARQATAVAEEANRAKSAFLATMSHEIRTPMNGVIGMVDVLAHSRLSADQADAVAIIRSSALALLGSIDDILDFSKIEAGGVVLEERNLALASLVQEVCHSLGPMAAGKAVSLQFALDPGLPQHVRGDPTRLRQVLYNLVGNAIKFSAGRPDTPGRVMLRVDVQTQAEPPCLAFVVADNGIGIAPDALTRLFMPFVQGDATTTRRFGGTGLGLVISKRLVELMHGEIVVSSTPGKGSTFTMTVPLELASGPAADAADQTDTGSTFAPPLSDPSSPAWHPLAAGTPGSRILVAEDDAVSQKVILRQLALLGHAADVVENGAEALRCWRRGGHVMLITDLHMPEMDGHSLVQAIRSEEMARDATGATRIPILALTANASHEEEARAHASGMDGYLTKPVQLATLRARLAHWLPERQAATTAPI